MQMDGAAMMPQKTEIIGFRFPIRFKMQPGVKKTHRKSGESPRNLTELSRGEHGIIERLDLPEDDARRLMELGFLPGHSVTPAHSAPGGDPRVFRVDGSEVALRRETARKLILRPKTAEDPMAEGPVEG
jgi:ferrous iron transport protein A